jgi:hypothetical protein
MTMSEKCTVLYRPPQKVGDIGDFAREIIDDVLIVQAAVGSMTAARGEAEQALCRIQRKARSLLGGVTARPLPVDGLVDLVTRLERGETVRRSELRQTLVSLQVAMAKIEQYLAVSNGVDLPAA